MKIFYFFFCLSTAFSFESIFGISGVRTNYMDGALGDASTASIHSLSSLSFLCDFFLSRDLRLDSRLFERRLRSDRSLLRERSLHSPEK